MHDGWLHKPRNTAAEQAGSTWRSSTGARGVDVSEYALCIVSMYGRPSAKQLFSPATNSKPHTAPHITDWSKRDTHHT